MSVYTTELRFVLEDMAGHHGSPQQVINDSWDKLFDFDFPIFDEAYRQVLCTKILKHYYTREIGEDTVGLWKLRLDERMNIIMPYYNQFYELERKKLDPFITTDLKEKFKGSGTRDETEATENGSEATGSTTRTGSETNHTETSGSQTDATTGKEKTVGQETGSSEEDSTSRTTGTKDGRNEENSSTDDTRNITKHSEVDSSNSSDSTVNVNGVTNTNNTGTSHSETEQSTDSTKKQSDTPQNGLSDLQTDKYMSFAEIDNSDSTSSTDGNTSDTGRQDSTQDTVSHTSAEGNATQDDTHEEQGSGSTNKSGSFNEGYQDSTTGGKTSSNEKNTTTTTDSEGSLDRRNQAQENGSREHEDNESRSDRSNSTGTRTTGAKSTDDYLKTIKGRQGQSYASLLMEYRETIINIDKRIIDQLEDLFMLIW